MKKFLMYLVLSIIFMTAAASTSGIQDYVTETQSSDTISFYYADPGEPGIG
ncbi:hypothetical protein [Thalassobacillus pellis]|uniref:hypothetical protein n=1 Tax=Thalassobacillus pellis TaxID=748008 RepID=UPI0019608A97|nr:hypothetical protein [Thalassobacillus pellis]MBM7553771.1 hypothetical protein [Thalassobacillus pellis]